MSRPAMAADEAGMITDDTQTAENLLVHLQCSADGRAWVRRSREASVAAARDEAPSEADAARAPLALVRLHISTGRIP